MTELLEKMAAELEKATPEVQAQALEILGLIDGYTEQRNDMIDTMYNGINAAANNGEKEAQIIMSYGSEEEVKSVINESINRKSY